MYYLSERTNMEGVKYNKKVESHNGIAFALVSRNRRSPRKKRDYMFQMQEGWH